MKKISIIVPCYNEQETIPIFYNEIVKVLKKMPLNYELLFIDDGSNDSTLKVIKILKQEDKNIKYISFSKNFGKEAAMYAGLENAVGDYIAIMDVDLQDPPELLPIMYNYLKSDNYDIVATKRKNRKGEPFFRSLLSKIFYKIINKMSKIEMVDGARDYRLMTKQVVNSILSLKEYNRYSKGIFSFVGYRTKWIEYENKERINGKTKWSLNKLFKYAMEGILSFSSTPLLISSFLGIMLCTISFLAILFIIAKTVIFGDPVSGWPSLVCIILLLSGIQLLCMGIIGAYLSKIYLEVKSRPIYIIKEKSE